MHAIIAAKLLPCRGSNRAMPIRRIFTLLLLTGTCLGCASGPVQPLREPAQNKSKIAVSELTASDYSAGVDVLALGYRDGSFEVRTPAPHHLLSRGKHESAIANLALSPDGMRLATVDEMGTLAVSVLESGQLRVLSADARLRGAPGTIIGLSWDRASQRLAVAVGTLVRVIDLETETKHEAELEQAVTALAFTPDGKQLVAASRRVQFLSLPDLRVARSVDLSQGGRALQITDVRFSQDGRVLGVLMLGGAAFVDTGTGQLDVAHFRNFDPVGLRFGADGRVLVFARRSLYVGPPEAKQVEAAAHPLSGDLSDVEFRKDGSLLFVGDAEDAELASLLE
jgi:WD40 repeat protein